MRGFIMRQQQADSILDQWFRNEYESLMIVKVDKITWFLILFLSTVYLNTQGLNVMKLFLRGSDIVLEQEYSNKSW